MAGKIILDDDYQGFLDAILPPAEAGNTSLARAYQRAQSRYETRVDFELLESIYDELVLEADAKIRELLKKAEGRTIEYVERLISSKLRPSDVAVFQIDVGKDVSRALTEYLTDVWRKAKDAAFKELPGEIKKKAEKVKKFQIGTGFEPTEALEFFQTRGLIVKGLIDSNLSNQAKNILAQHLRGGRTAIETIGDLRRLFEPYVGDPTKIVPSGPGTPTEEKILEAFRLENILRTETTTALTEGRLAMGDATEGYVIGYEYSAIMDQRTTKICQEADGLVIRADDPRLRRLEPPTHFQCRSTLVYVTQDDVPVNYSSDAEIDAAVRLIQDGFD
jgi:SPP1 gp7 family putative phage head morphogenesis protein